MKKLQPSTEEKIIRSKACYLKENDQPCLGFFLGDEYPNQRYPSYSKLPEGRPLTPEDFPLEPFLNDCERLFQDHQKCGGDLFWTGTPFWGIPWIEAMLGCDLFFNSASCSISAANTNNKVTLETLPEFSESNPWVKLFGEFFEALEAHSAGRYPIGTTRIRGLADILSVIYGGEEFIITAMTEEAEIIKHLDKITPFYIDVMKYQLRHIPEFHGGMGSFYYYNWTPPNTVWHQEDSVMLLSPSLYQNLFYAYDKKIYTNFENNICHFHSTGGYAPYKEILSLNPLCIEMHLDFGGPSAQELFSTHKEILSKSSLLIWGDFTSDDLEWVYNNLPPAGLFLSVRVNSETEANSIWEKYSKS